MLQKPTIEALKTQRAVLINKAFNAKTGRVIDAQVIELNKLIKETKI